MRLPGNLDLEKGELLNARAENLATLPAFVPGEDEGRLIYVTTGSDQGLWIGGADGTAVFKRFFSEGHVGAYSSTGNTLADGASVDLTISESNAAKSLKGFVAKVTPSSPLLTSGQIRVEMYEEAAKTNKFYDAYFDMANPFPDRFPAYFELDNTTGDLYVTITNLTGSMGDFDVEIITASSIPFQTPAPPGDGSGVNSGVAGEGIAYDAANGRLDVDLKANGGLELTGAVGSKELSVDVAAGGGLTDSGSGLEIDSSVGVVAGTDQAGITNLKGFVQLGMTPTGITGPPVAGAHVAGEFSMDSAKDIWLCTVAGTPGTWVFFGWKEEEYGGAVNGTSYTGTIAAGANEILEVPTTGRRGFIRKLLVWGADAAYAASDIDVPFRVTCYPNENKHGREQLWTVNGQVRKTYETAGAGAGGATLTLNTVGHTNLDDLVRIRNAAGVTEENQRITARNVGGLTATIDETLVEAIAINDNVMFVNEWVSMPWRNNSGVGANSQKIYLEFKNDDASQAVVFGYYILFESIGGGLPI